MPSDSTIHLIGVIVTILIFLVGIIINSKLDRDKQKRARRSYLIALKEEIAINIKSLDKSINMFPDSVRLNAFLDASTTNRPIMTFTFHNTVFSTRTEVLQDLEDKVINGIVDFYGRLSELKTDVSAIENKSFETISKPARQQCFQVIFEEHRSSKDKGEAVIALISVALNNK
jgi:hypothetical protein